MKNKCGFLFHMLLYSVTIMIITLITGCSTSTSEQNIELALKSAVPYYRDNAIRITITATTDLNAYHNQANSCSLYFIQAQNREVLDKLIARRQLLQEMFNGDQRIKGVLQIDEHTMMPGEKVHFNLARVEDARYLAIIAGYYPFPGPDYSVVTGFPISLHKNGYFISNYTATFSPLLINLKLGKVNIVKKELSQTDGKRLETKI
jgi:predicted component of type VI protein secretion system